MTPPQGTGYYDQLDETMSAPSAASVTKAQNLSDHLFKRLSLRAESGAGIRRSASSLAVGGAQQFRVLRANSRCRRENRAL
jgi:hypothetical protein